MKCFNYVQGPAQRQCCGAGGAGVEHGVRGIVCWNERLVVLGSYRPQRGGERTDDLDVKRWEEKGCGELGFSLSVASAGSQPHCYVGPQPLRPLPNHCLCQKV